MVLRNISFSYDKNNLVLNNFCFDFSRKGISYILIGPNGCGKTTILKIITSLIKDYKGEVINDTYKKIRANFTSYGLDPSKTGRKNVGMLEIEKNRDFKKLIEYYGDRLNMKKNLNKKVSRMSSGMQLKTKLILMFSAESDLLIFDEPVNPLDSNSVVEFFSIINELNERGTSCIMSMHLNHITSLDSILRKDILNLDLLVEK